jgi:hypothetical protein
MLLVCAAAALVPVQWLQANTIPLFQLHAVLSRPGNTDAASERSWCLHAEQGVDDGPSTSGRTAEGSLNGADVLLATEGEDTIASLVTGES